jgi:hypothetical protein
MRFEIIVAVFIALTISSCQPGKKAAEPHVRLGPEVKALVEEILVPLENPVTIRITRGGEGETNGEEVQALVDLVSAISPMVSVTGVDISTNPDTHDPGVSHGPIMEMRGQAPGTLRYYGFPERRETRPFLEGILLASGHQTDLVPEIRSFISALDEEVWIRIFATPD